MKTVKGGTKRIWKNGKVVTTESEMEKETIIGKLNNVTIYFLHKARKEEYLSSITGPNPNIYDDVAEECRKTATASNLAARELERLWKEERTGTICEKPVKATKSNKYWAVCEGCGEHFRIFMLAGKKAKYCPNCGKRVEYERDHDAGAGAG